MIKLSPAYREDSDEGMPTAIKAYLDEHFLKELKNCHVSHPKLLVVFSGGNAVGKSALSQKILRELRATVIENDAIKSTLLDLLPTIDSGQLQLLTWQYTMDLYKRISGEIKNGLIVRDGVIDWYYDRILPIFEAQGYALFIVGYELSEQKIIELIRSRGDKQAVSVKQLVAQLCDHAIHQKRFREIYKLDVVLNDDTLFDDDVVIEMIRQKLQALEP